jgi:hypothetical protein
MWDTLGIQPTTEVTLIRRAYAARLRSLDVDRNPAAFIALREAYEHALASCEIAEPWPLDVPVTAARPGAPRRADAAPEPLGHNVREPPAEHLPDDWLDVALAAGGIMAALEAYNRNMARGLIGLGQQRRHAADLAAAALRDPALPIATFRAAITALGVQHGGTRHDDLAPLRGDIAARLAAYEWFEALGRTARKRAFGRKKHDVRGRTTAPGYASPFEPEPRRPGRNGTRACRLSDACQVADYGAKGRRHRTSRRPLATGHDAKGPAREMVPDRGGRVFRHRSALRTDQDAVLQLRQLHGRRSPASRCRHPAEGSATVT